MSSTTLFQIEPYGDAGALANARRPAKRMSFAWSAGKTSAALWTVQALLAALFVFAGVSKLVAPIDVIAQQAQLPGEFMLFIGVAETLGGIGLILPGLLRIRRELTVLAALGIVSVMAGATALTLVRGLGALALIPFVVGSLAAVVANGRRNWRQA